MKKKLLGFLMIANICLCVACNNHSVKEVDEVQESQEDDRAIDAIKKIGSKIGENDIYIASENIYLHFYKNFTHKTGFSIDCLSSTAIDINKVGVKIDIATPYDISVEEVEDEVLDLDTYELFAEYDNKLEKEKDEEQYKEYSQKYEEDFKKLKNSDIGELHHYVVNISFQLNHELETETFSSIKIEYNGKDFEKNIGEVVIDYREENPKHEKSLYASCVSMSDIYLSKNTEGIMKFEGDNMYQAEKPLEITNMYLINKDTEVRNGSFRLNSSDTSHDVSWEGKSIEIDEDTQVGVNAEFFREDFKDKTCYQYSDYLVIEYREGNEKYKTGTELYFRTKLTGYQLYAYFLDNIELFEV